MKLNPDTIYLVTGSDPTWKWLIPIRLPPLQTPFAGKYRLLPVLLTHWVIDQRLHNPISGLINLLEQDPALRKSILLLDYWFIRKG